MDNINIVRGLAIDRKPFELSGSGTATSSGTGISTVADCFTNFVGTDINTLKKLKVNSTDTDDDSHYDGVKEKLVEEYTIGGDPATYATFTLEVTSGETTGGAFYFETLDGTTTDSATILSGDTAEQIATKLRALIMGDGEEWIIGGSGTTVTVTYSSVGNITNLIQVGTDETTTCDFTYDDEWVDGTWEGGAKQERVIFVIDAATNNGGNITIDYNGTEVITAILNTDDADAIADKLVADAPTGYIANNIGGGMAIELVCEEPEAHAIPISVDAGTTGVSFTDYFHTAGVDPTGGALVPGDIDIYFNSATPVTIQAEEGDEVADIYAKIAAAAPTGYTASSTGNITIECDEDGAHAVHLSIDLGTTGITKSSSTLTEGTDSTSGTGARTVKLYCVGSGTGSAAWKTEVVALNGQSQVETTGEYYFCYHTEVLTSGSSNKNEGTIYVGTGNLTSYIPAKVYSAIAPNASVSEDYALFVPVNQKGFIEKVAVSNPSTSEMMKLSLAYIGNGQSGMLRKEYNIVPGNTEIEFDYPLSVPSGTLVYPLIKSTSASASVSVSTSGLVVYS